MNTAGLIKLEVTPEQIDNAALPVDFMGKDSGDPMNGFSDKELTIEFQDGKATLEVTYEVSYDGESELLASVKEKPQRVSSSSAEDMLREFFTENDEDEEEDEEDVEEEE
jgi:hypothetical protein